MGVPALAIQLETTGVHVTIQARLPGPWAADKTALVTRHPDDSWDAQVAATAPQAAVVATLATVATLRRYGAGNTGWKPGPDGTLWAYF